MVTDMYSHIMNHNHDRKQLARRMDEDFFSSSPAEAIPTDESTMQLMKLIQSSPDIAPLLLQMTQVLGKNG